MECGWRPKRREPRPWHPQLTHSTYGQPRLPFIRSNQGRLIHRIRYWWLMWEREDGVTRFRSASPHTWCGCGLGTRAYHLGADVRLMADGSESLCRRCFPCEVIDKVFETGRFDA